MLLIDQLFIDEPLPGKRSQRWCIHAFNLVMRPYDRYDFHYSRLVSIVF